MYVCIPVCLVLRVATRCSMTDNMAAGRHSTTSDGFNILDTWKIVLRIMYYVPRHRSREDSTPLRYSRDCWLPTLSDTFDSAEW
ncbi:hypothetical protein C8Q80DRAFT_906788 [Daedaleopsis nitida]|nr:hypothetical protein C8Q80DRAFT_906788 [Daedaleopsis nitida]